MSLRGLPFPNAALNFKGSLPACKPSGSSLSDSRCRFCTGHTLNYYSSELSKNLDQDDIFYLSKGKGANNHLSPCLEESLQYVRPSAVKGTSTRGYWTEGAVVKIAKQTKKPLTGSLLPRGSSLLAQLHLQRGVLEAIRAPAASRAMGRADCFEPCLGGMASLSCALVAACSAFPCSRVET